jgi:hypothetical protein
MDFGPQISVREGAAEVRAKLKSDLSRWTKARRAVSLRPTILCAGCDGTGRVTCATCEGAGQSRIVFGDSPEACATCEGRGTVTCVDCSGRGQVVNAHRKMVLWLLVVGGLAWVFVLWSLLGRDVAPETVAKLKGGGGGGFHGTISRGGVRGAAGGPTVLSPGSNVPLGAVRGGGPSSPAPALPNAAGYVGRPAGPIGR